MLIIFDRYLIVLNGLKIINLKFLKIFRLFDTMLSLTFPLIAPIFRDFLYQISFPLILKNPLILSPFPTNRNN